MGNHAFVTFNSQVNVGLGRFRRCLVETVQHVNRIGMLRNVNDAPHTMHLDADLVCAGCHRTAHTRRKQASWQCDAIEPGWLCLPEPEQTVAQTWQVDNHHLPHHIQIHAKIVVNDHVSKSRNCSPWHIGCQRFGCATETLTRLRHGLETSRSCASMSIAPSKSQRQVLCFQPGQTPQLGQIKSVGHGVFEMREISRKP